jgi:hypothetical protein
MFHWICATVVLENDALNSSRTNRSVPSVERM